MALQGSCTFARFVQHMSDLKEARLEQGWSRAELARRSGVSESNIGRLERGIIRPRFDTARALAAALGGHPDDLFPQETVAV